MISATQTNCRRVGSLTQWVLCSLTVVAIAYGPAVVGSSLPTDIEVDLRFQEAIQRLSREDYWGAARSMAKILLMAEEDETVQLPTSYWFYDARIHEGLDELEKARDSVTAYLKTAGKEGEFYSEAIQLLIGLDEKLPAWQRKKDILSEANETVRNQRVLAAQTVVKEDLASGAHGPELVLVGAGFVPFGGTVEEVGPIFAAKYETSVGEFSLFVDAAGYETDAERMRKNGCSSFPDTWGTSNQDRVKGNSRRHWRSPGFTQTDRHPVVCVSINDARAYARWLSDQTGGSYRLPTHVEWLLIARAGTHAASELVHFRSMLEERVASKALDNQYYGDCYGVDGGYCATFGVDRFGMPGPSDPAGSSTLAAGESVRNAIGVFELWGNASEFVESCFENYEGREFCRTLGTSFRYYNGVYSLSSHPYVYRSVTSVNFNVPNNSADTGFRVVRDLDD